MHTFVSFVRYEEEEPGLWGAGADARAGGGGCDLRYPFPKFLEISVGAPANNVALMQTFHNECLRELIHISFSSGSRQGAIDRTTQKNSRFSCVCAATLGMLCRGVSALPKLAYVAGCQ